MIAFIGQIVGCLLVAAGIGGAVGWLLRHLSAGELAHQFMNLTTTLRLKEQTLEKLQHEMNAQAAAMQILESKMIESEELDESTRQELSARNDRLQALQEELAIRTQRLTILEAEETSLRRRASENEATAAQLEEARQFHLTSQATQQAIEANEQERHNLQRRVAELEAGVAEADRLRARVEELEPAQGRVHWLEVQLCDRDAEYRAALHQLNSQLAERDQRIGKLEFLSQHLQEHEQAIAHWETKYARAITQHEAQIATLQQQLTAQEQLRAQLQLNEDLLHERAEHINGLQQRIQEFETQQQDLADQAKTAGEKQEEIARLRKRLVEVRAALRIKTDGGSVAPRLKTRPNGSQLSLEMEQAKAAKDKLKDKPKDGPKDDLSKIHGIGPAFARTLYKMGLYSYGQIARWTPEDINKVAKKLYTAPDRIKRDNWIAGAKRQHREKYGENL
jgi:predicted flap endonuclease-1-like 5' DNA nuclease